MVQNYFQYFDPNIGTSDWYVLAILATMTAVLVHLFLQMFGKAFSMEELERYAKSEMLQAGATLVMIIFLVVMVQQASSLIMVTYFGCDPANIEARTDADGNPTGYFECNTGDKSENINLFSFVCPDKEKIDMVDMQSPYLLLQCRMKDRANTFASLIQESFSASRMAYFQQSVYFSLFGIPIYQGGYSGSLHKQIETYRIIMNMCTTMLIATNTVNVLADYAKNNALSFFLPLGLLLRSFHFTRSMGAFFISLGLCFYFIFPLLYIISDPTYIKPPPPMPGPPQVSDCFNCYPTFTGVVHQITSPLTSNMPIASDMSLDALKSDLSRIYFAVILYPFAIFSVTLVFLRQFMYLLGGESQDILRFVSKVV